ncbi:MAG: hypothetical protein ABW106_02625 [Steroidobacteraceae bacterium]
MKRIVAASVLCCMFIQASRAQESAQQPAVAPPTVEREVLAAYASCEAIDVITAGIQPDKWVSPVFEFSYLQGLLSHRLSELATEFEAAIASQGRPGDGNCLLGASRQELEQSNADTRKTLSRRFLGVVAVKYHDVAWTPGPWDAQAAMTAPASKTQFIFCHAQQELVTLASGVIEVSMPIDDAQHSAELQRYSDNFKRDVLDNRLTDSYATCVDSNTRAQAQRKLSDLRTLNSRHDRFTEVNWQPTSVGSAAESKTAVATPATPNVVHSTSASPLTITEFRPVEVNLQSLALPSVLRAPFGFCHQSGTMDSVQKVFMTPVFSMQNPDGQPSATLAQRFGREFRASNDPAGQPQPSLEFCYLAGSRAEAEIRRNDYLSAYSLPNAASPDRVVQLIMTDWSPAGAAVASTPQGSAVPLNILCSVQDSVSKTIYYTEVFSAPGIDASAQLQAVQSLHADYRRDVIASQRPAAASAATCTASESRAFVEQKTAGRARQLATMGYRAFSVNWKPAE